MVLSFISFMMLRVWYRRGFMCLKLNLMHSKRIEVVLGPSELRFI